MHSHSLDRFYNSLASSHLIYLILAGINLAASVVLRAEVTGVEKSVVVIYNSAMPESKSVANHYADIRNIPENHLIGLELSKEETISRKDFNETLHDPLFQIFKDREFFDTDYEIVPATRERPGTVYQNLQKSKIRYLVLCYGVPVRIEGDPNLHEDATESMRVELRFNGAAVDHELSWFGRDPKRLVLAGPIENPLYATQKATDLHPENGVMIVSRLDGPTPEIAKGLVDKAIQAEKEGLWGRTYFDARGIRTGSYLLGDNWIRSAAQLAAKAGFETTLDDQENLFSEGFPMSQIAFYAGWYTAHVTGPFTREEVEFMPGAIAYHLHSESAAKLRTSDKHWAGPLLAKGATATMGCVYEPYLGATPDIAVFFERLLMGFSFGEAAYACQRVLSWQTTIVGDPLYLPLSKPIELLQMELGGANSPLLAWVRILAANQALQNGAEKTAVLEALESDPLSKLHPALCEKLADLYMTLNRQEEAIYTYERALKLKPTPQQRNRILLELAGIDRQAGKLESAIQRMEALLEADPDYPEKENLLSGMKRIAESGNLDTKLDDINIRLEALNKSVP